MPPNRWRDSEVGAWPGELGSRIYTSRLLGRDTDLVLHGGGNTSVKTRHTTVFGEDVEVLVVKGSGADLAEVDESTFAWLDLDHVRRLAQLEELTDTEMARQLALGAVGTGGPAPSVEAILHAVLPYRFVDHTHADAVVTLTNTPAGMSLVDEVYGDRVVVVPYVMPGFRLAQACARRVADGIGSQVEGMVLMNHGIFTWGETARESYDRMIELVGLAEGRVRTARSPATNASGGQRRAAARGNVARVERAVMRRDIAGRVGAPVLVRWVTDEPAMEFANRPDVGAVSQRGPVTPDHVIRTKPWPMIGRDTEAFAAAYQAYVEEHRHRARVEVTALDSGPRVVLDPELGLGCVGRTASDADVVADIYRHTMQVVIDATALGGYQPISAADLFDMEYWELEQAKLKRRGAPASLAGQVAMVTGAASGIGRACAAALLGEGAAVVGLDVDPSVVDGFAGPAWLGLETDVADPTQVDRALDGVVERFGGLDMLVLNAGVFPPSQPIAEIEDSGWRSAMALNVDAAARVLRDAHPVLRLALGNGRVVVIGSKNVAAPGPGAAAYSSSKAALTQLARVAALEWGAAGIRVNIIHPNAVFDTALWTDEVLAARAESYGQTVEEYRRTTVLGLEVASADVARMCVAMCGAAFSRTTGAQVPVDGGNDRVI